MRHEAIPDLHIDPRDPALAASYTGFDNACAAVSAAGRHEPPGAADASGIGPVPAHGADPIPLFYFEIETP